jgi:hypothetical protein
LGQMLRCSNAKKQLVDASDKALIPQKETPQFKRSSFVVKITRLECEIARENRVPWTGCLCPMSPGGA